MGGPERRPFPAPAPRGLDRVGLVAAARLDEAKRAVESAVFRAVTIARVGWKTGMHANLRPAGALVLARELPRGKSNPSLVFKLHAANDPHRTGLTYREQSYSFYEISARMDRVGGAFAGLGLGRRSVALVLLKNRPELVFLQPGLGRIGASMVAASWRSTPGEIEYLAKHSGARAIVFDADIAPVVREVLPRLPLISQDRAFVVGGEAEGFATLDELLDRAGGLPPDASEEAAVVTYTSGTTGKPKGAVRKFPKDAMAAAFAFIGETPMRVGDVHLAVCPLYHATAFGFVALSYILGAKVVLLDEFKPEAFLEAVERYRVTTTAVVPTMLHRLMELGEARIRRYDTSSLRAIFSGGAPLPAGLALDVMNVLGDKLYNFYGATETGLVTLASPHDLRRSPGTIGRVLPGNEVRLVDERGRDVPIGEVGELFVRSPLLVEGYHADPEATRASMLEGYFSVGDLARRDARGCYFIEGRKRDMVISGGVNVYPAEVEAALDSHPAVAEAAVVGVPDREWGELVRAFVALRPGAECDASALKAHCRERLAGPKVPREIVFLPALPRNPTGKVLKRELRER
jgi:fatty-acyl-CoA synthase